MTRRVIIILVLGVTLVAAVVFGFMQYQNARSAKTQAGLAKGQAGAAMESGQDAVGTVGNTSARETGIDRTVEEGTDEIDRAPAGNSNDAADRATCRLRSYRHLPKCVALLGPAPN